VWEAAGSGALLRDRFALWLSSSDLITRKSRRNWKCWWGASARQRGMLPVVKLREALELMEGTR
jgi:hypothetical protein